LIHCEEEEDEEEEEEEEKEGGEGEGEGVYQISWGAAARHYAGLAKPSLDIVLGWDTVV
jgi:hypothetical protein